MMPNALKDLREDEVLDDATQTLQRSRTHYGTSEESWTRDRLAELYRLVFTCFETHDLAPLTARAGQIAEERFQAGFGIEEVQAAFNVLEEQIWHRVVAEAQPGELAEAIGLLSTVMGAAKDALACAYVSLATHRRVRSLDLTALFSGVTSLP